MNQDFTVKKKNNICLKKKFVQRSPEKKIPAQAVSEKKKFVQAENSPSPPPPHHFSKGPSLNYSREFRAWTDAFVEFLGGELVDEREKYRTGVAYDSPITPSVVPLCSATGSGASFEDIVRLGRGKWFLALLAKRPLFTRRLAYEHRMIIRPSLSLQFDDLILGNSCQFAYMWEWSFSPLIRTFTRVPMRVTIERDVLEFY